MNDTSTIDFAFLPEVLGPEDIEITPMRVPILPDVNFNKNNAALEVEEAVVVLPQISTMVSVADREGWWWSFHLADTDMIVRRCSLSSNVG